MIARELSREAKIMDDASKVLEEVRRTPSLHSKNKIIKEIALLAKAKNIFILTGIFIFDMLALILLLLTWQKNGFFYTLSFGLIFFYLAIRWETYYQEIIVNALGKAMGLFRIFSVKREEKD